jgi:chorismate mutase
MQARAIRGAVQVEENSRASIAGGARLLITEVLRRNGVSIDEIIAVFFTATSDLDTEVPARAVRELGSEWSLVPFQCASEMEVHHSMRRVIRVLVLCETEKKKEEIHHVYLGEASRLRPDLTEEKTP